MTKRDLAQEGCSAAVLETKRHILIEDKDCKLVLYAL